MDVVIVATDRSDVAVGDRFRLMEEKRDVDGVIVAKVIDKNNRPQLLLSDTDTWQYYPTKPEDLDWSIVKGEEPWLSL
ncbi:hypothetical protein UFOVP45_111 [uncultured Caudovirales phage]|uniref:Uncharacterized protein n=1 Tax=uncultured Caudovirales phage TaxID=2100421 RepID=A0A6J5KVF0_9CAUD|nr:hypothetical protein UFOVP45_111 [uncultured Caudovirales phage]